MVKRLDKWSLTTTVLKLYEGHLCLRDFKLPEFITTAQTSSTTSDIPHQMNNCIDWTLS